MVRGIAVGTGGSVAPARWGLQSLGCTYRSSHLNPNPVPSNLQTDPTPAPSLSTPNLHAPATVPLWCMTRPRDSGMFLAMRRRSGPGGTATPSPGEARGARDSPVPSQLMG